MPSRYWSNQFITNKHEGVGIKEYNKNDSKYSNDIDDIYENIAENNADTQRNILIAFDNMIADTLRNKRLNPVVTELFI